MEFFKKHHIIAGLVLIIFGIVLLVRPGRTLDIVCDLIGAAIMIAGIVGVIEGLIGKRGDPMAAANFVGNVFAILAGILLIAFSGAIVAVFPFIFGMLLIVYSAAEIFMALKAPGGAQIGRMLMAVLELILAILILANPFSTTILLVQVLGVSIIFSGIMQFIN